MKFGKSILLFLSIFVIIGFLSTACNDNSTNPSGDNLGSDVSAMYQDSILFLTNRFSSDSTTFHIAIINADGSGMRVLFDKWNITYANWSLNTGRIYFSADTNGDEESYQIYSCDMNCQNETLLYSTTDYVGEIKVSPDGSKLLIMLTRNSGNKLVMLDLITLQVSELTDYLVQPVSVAWSPDGSTLASAYKNEGDVNLEIFKLENQFFTHERVFIDMVRPNNYVDWSRATEKIAILVNHYSFSLLYCYDYYTKTDYQLTVGNFVTNGISWSQTGQRVVLAESLVWIEPNNPARLLQSSLYVYNVDGTNKVQITDDTFVDKYPCWQ